MSTDSSEPMGATSPQDNSTGGELLPVGSCVQGSLERKVHTKSRKGCFNCKRRRVKCQETRPACGHCLKTGLMCDYAAVPSMTHQLQHQIPLFSLLDMRLFQHFLLQCYPVYPPANENIWTHEVPCLSQTHKHLMHAILALSASDLMPKDPSLLTFAMGHRVHAIQAIKKRLTDISRSSNNTYEESNAMVATCLALTFQSVMLDDGMVEFMTFLRGILIVGMQMWVKGVTPMFTNIQNDDAEATLEPAMGHLPLIERQWADMALNSIQNLGPLCRETVEMEYHGYLMEWVQNLYVSSFEAYKILRKHYGWWMMLPHDKFRQVIDPSNQVMMLLATHWIALKQVMTFITETENQVRAKFPKKQPDEPIDSGLLRWLKWLNRHVDVEHQVYNQWPIWVEEQLDRDISFFGKTQ